jgi:hypothetical protein
MKLETVEMQETRPILELDQLVSLGTEAREEESGKATTEAGALVLEVGE